MSIGGLLLLEDVEQHLADGAVADQGDLEPLLFFAMPIPREFPSGATIAGAPRALRPWGAAAITRPPDGV